MIMLIFNKFFIQNRGFLMSKKTVGIIAALLLIAGVAIFAVYSNPELKSKFAELTGQKKIPSKIVVTKDETIKLIKNNMQVFALSVKEKDMTKFYDNISDYWQKRTSVEELNKTFDPFIQSGIDLTLLKNMQPIIDRGTKVTDKKDLYIVGHYNTKPSVVRFKQTYRYQKKGGWKLVEFFVEVK